MSNFITRPHFEDRQIVQYTDESIKLSGETIIASTILDFTGSTTAQTSVTISNLTGYLNGDNIVSGLIVNPPILKISGSTGTTSVNVTGWVLTAYDSDGRVMWAPNSSADTNTFITGGTLSGTSLILDYNTGGSTSPVDLSGLVFTGNTSGTCITDLYVDNIYGCDVITVWDSVQTIGSSATGLTSFAFGISNSAFGIASHAEGGNTVALGDTSHSEGAYTIASGDSSHAEGYYTTALFDYSHAGGYYSKANGLTSFIHSTNSIVSGNRSVVLGGQNITGTTDDTVYVPYLNIGNVTTGTSVSILGITSGGTVIEASDFYDEICDFCNSNVSSDMTIGSGVTETSWLNTDGSSVDSTSPYSCTQWCYYRGGDYVGTTTDYLTALKYEESGYTLRCCDSNSSDGGTNYGISVSGLTTATGGTIPIVITGLTRPYTIKNTKKIYFNNVYNSDILNSNQASLTDSTLSLIELSTLSSIRNSFNSTIYNSYLSSVLSSENGFITGSGNANIIGSQYSILSGVTGSTIVGGNNITGTTNDTVYVPNLEIYNRVESFGSSATGTTSFAFGDGVNAHGNYSHAEGGQTMSIGIFSHSEGYGTTASGNYSHSEGYQTLASNDEAHAEGFQTSATTKHSHAEGYQTITLGLSAHAEGRLTTASGDYSHTEGHGTVASGNHQHVQGEWNVIGDTTSGAFILGNGTNDLNRSNLIFAAGNQVNISGKTITTTFQMTSGATNGYVLTSDASGNGTWQPVSGGTGGGGISINPYYTEPSNTTITWDVSGNSTNYQTTLTANTTLNLTNVRNGEYGTIILTQDAVGSRTVILGTVNGSAIVHKVSNGGAGSPVLTSTANATDILTFTYNGSNTYWNVGNDYT